MCNQCATRGNNARLANEETFNKSVVP